jgi:rare lipoprotein A
VKRLLAMALLAVALPAALAQEQGSDEDFNEAVAAANAGASAMAADSRPLARLESGIASWYGKQFHGRKTASGERFDMDALTAAHPKLPFGSWVRVRNLVNGRSVDVRINDRGPHIKQRVIDLSRAAARALGVSGTHQVEISVLDRQVR